MTPVYQRSLTDCLTACIASITGLPYEECPQLWEYQGIEWMRALRDWARSKGLGFCYFNIKDRMEWPALDGFNLIVTGTTSRSTEYLHCVVARAVDGIGTTELHWVHDPCPGGNFVTDPDHCIFFIK